LLPSFHFDRWDVRYEDRVLWRWRSCNKFLPLLAGCGAKINPFTQPQRAGLTPKEILSEGLGLMISSLFNGFVLGWSVAWPPGPVNAEMIRRGLLSREQGDGFWETWRVGLGACTGDFLWAFAVATGAGAILNKPGVRIILGIISLVLLLVLAAVFSRAAWQTARGAKNSDAPTIAGQTSAKGGYWLGFVFVLSSPWNIGFWLAVVGSQQTVMATPSLLNSLMLASAVVLGAVAWTIVLCAAVRLGARIFAHPGWQVWTQILTAAVMLYFATKLALQLFA
jgi:threonine/homoserine/homoserine lactone efflux protein